MTDYYRYNGENILPTYLPGVASYGQTGSEGNTGSIGPSVYYAAFNLSDAVELETCKLYIQEGLLLSNNLNTPGYSKYTSNDIIIDSTGTMYKLNNELDIVPFNTDETPMSASSAFGELTVSCATSFIQSSKYSHKIKNPALIELEKDDTNATIYPSYKIYHTDVYEDFIYGNWIKFDLKCKSPSAYSFTFTLVLPNGQCLSSVSTSPMYMMFVDNKWLYSCGNIANFKISENIELNSDIAAEIKNKTVSQLIDFQTYSNNGLKSNSKALSYLLSFYISKYCTAYVEAKDKLNGKVYRFDSSDMRVITDVESDEIEEKTPEAEWTPTEKEDSSIPTEEKDIEKRTIKLYRSFDPFVVLNSVKEYPTNDITKSETGFIQNLYFVNKTSLSNYEMPSIDADAEDYCIPLKEWKKKTSDVDNWKCVEELPHTLQLTIQNLSEVNFTIEFEAILNENNTFSKYPATAVYIGFPNLSIYQAGDSSSNVYLPNSSNIKYDEEGNMLVDEKGNYVSLPDGSTGYYYMYKIIPFGYTAADAAGEEDVSRITVADAGYAVVNFSCAKFGIDPHEKTTIEIGAMMIGQYSNTEHRLSIQESTANPDSDNYLIGEIPKDKLYTFQDSSTSGTPDVKIYVSGAKETIDTDLSNSEVDELEQIESDDIKKSLIYYTELGLQYDNPIIGEREIEVL